MNTINYRPIGIISSPFKQPKGTPIQPTAAKGVEGKVEVFSEFSEGLADLQNFSHIFLIYHFHLITQTVLRVKPFMDECEHGVFATRAPSRPNFIGLSVVRLERIEGSTLFIKDVDIVNGTPLLDIKPFVPRFDSREVTAAGWLEDNIHKLNGAKDDERFIKR